jgi:hypothetical protein
MRSRLVAVGMMIVLTTVGWGTAAASAPADAACWGQASRVFAQTGAMGEHSSSFATPRLGLRNLARALAEAGAIDDDSMQALGAFVAEELGLRIDACGT